jgi:predicted GH43/DUF377 family glycosyl hydrolase
MTYAPTIQILPVATKHSGGYNPSVAEYRNKSFLSYRYHPKSDHWRTQMVVVCDGVTKPLMLPEKYKDYSHEDGRYFQHDGRLYMSVTVARSRVNGQAHDPCLVGYGEMVEYVDGWYLANWVEPKHAENVWTKQTKNLVFESSKQGLLMTWATSPNHVVHLLDAQGGLKTGWRTESPKCPFGNYRGGTQSFPFEGKRLRFCHAVQNNPKAVQYWGYNLMAYIFEPEPPFRIVAVSQQPILAGNEDYTPNVPHWKPRICIPYGAVKHGDGWRVSVGLNDCECAMIDLTREDLNL